MKRVVIQCRLEVHGCPELEVSFFRKSWQVLLLITDIASPLPVSPDPPTDLGHVGAGQHHRDQLHDGEDGPQEGVDQQYCLHLCSHLVSKNLHTAVFPNTEIIARGPVIPQLVFSTSFVNIVTTARNRVEISVLSL